MKNIKKWAKEHKEEILIGAAGAVLGGLAVALIAKKIVDGNQVHSIWDSINTDTNERVGSMVLLKNGKQLPFEVPLDSGLSIEEALKIEV